MRYFLISLMLGLTIIGQPVAASTFVLPKALSADLDRSLKALKENKPQQAIKLLAPWVKERPQDLRVAHLYAYALSQTGRLEEAKATLEEALSGNEESSLAFLNLREILAQQAAISYAKALGRPAPKQQPNLALTPDDLLPPAPEPEPALASKSPSLDLSSVDLSAFGKEIRLRPRRGQEADASAAPASAAPATLPPQITSSVGGPALLPPPFPNGPNSPNTAPRSASRADAELTSARNPFERTPAPESYDPREEGRKVADLTRQWARVWAAKDFDAYLAFYSENFEPQQHPTREDWLEYRRPRVERAGKVVIELSDLKVRPLSDGHLEVRFRQRYDAPNTKTNASRFLIWAREGSGWKIIREEGR